MTESTKGGQLRLKPGLELLQAAACLRRELQGVGDRMPCAVRANRELEECGHGVVIGMTNDLWDRGRIGLSMP
jgi:hypothetical protein